MLPRCAGLKEVGAPAFLPVLRQTAIISSYYPPDLKWSPNAAEKAAAARHGGGSNMVFCDGHAQDGKTKQFFDFTDDSVVKLWNRDQEIHRLP
jgi:prepilin-type processing-associated H-X9-DG protein